MMDYIPGHLHEKLQNEHYYLINSDFVWSNCNKKRFADIDGKDWDNLSKVNLTEGDVIVFRFFKSSTSSIYTYLERVIYSNGDIIEYKTESIISLGFVIKNEQLFTEVTKSFERDKKIESILC